MLMVCPNEGKTKILDEIFRLTTTRESFKLDLFVNNYTVDDNTQLVDVTIATFTGYATVNIARADWGAATETANVGNIIKSVAAAFSCTAGAPQTAYGWVLHGATSGVVYFGQNFNTARVMGPGATVTIDPTQISDKTFT